MALQIHNMYGESARFTPFLRSPGAGIDDDMVERGEDIAKGKVRKRKEKKAGKIKNNK